MQEMALLADLGSGLGSGLGLKLALELRLGRWPYLQTRRSGSVRVSEIGETNRELN